MPRLFLLALATLILAPTAYLATAYASFGTAHRQPGTGPAEADISPFGEPEDQGAYPDQGMLLAVRFDPPFQAPYEITEVSFPSFTSSGAPAVFESVSLCELDQAAGLVRLGTPIITVGPFVGSSNGWNEIPVNTVIHDSDRVLFLCFVVPSAVPVEDRPLLRWDIRITERGEFLASYVLHPSGRLIGNFAGNFVASMRCRLPGPHLLPLEPTQGFGANRIQGGAEFYFTPSRDVRSDSLASRPDALERTDLLFRRRSEPWSVVHSAGRHSDRLELGTETLDSLGEGYWATQSVSRNNIRSCHSNAVWMPFGSHQWFQDDLVHPNGKASEATPIDVCRAACSSVDAALFPAGDLDFWSFEAVPGELLRAVLIPSPQVHNQLIPTLELYDRKEKLVARSEGSFHLNYIVPGRGNAKSASYTLLVKDGLTSPSGAPAPRLLTPPWYNIRIEGSSRAGVAKSEPLELTSFREDGVLRFRYQLPITLRQSGHRLQIYDVHGRLTRTIRDSEREGLTGTDLWDQTDNAGSPVRSGVYFARLQVGGAEEILKIMVVR